MQYITSWISGSSAVSLSASAQADMNAKFAAGYQMLYQIWAASANCLLITYVKIPPVVAP